MQISEKFRGEITSFVKSRLQDMSLEYEVQDGSGYINDKAWKSVKLHIHDDDIEIGNTIKVKLRLRDVGKWVRMLGVRDNDDSWVVEYEEPTLPILILPNDAHTVVLDLDLFGTGERLERIQAHAQRIMDESTRALSSVS